MESVAKFLFNAIGNDIHGLLSSRQFHEVQQALLPTPPAGKAMPKSGLCEEEFYRKDLGVRSFCGRNFGHDGEHSWYNDPPAQEK